MQSEPVHTKGHHEQEWQLLAILAVDKEDRVQCQCNGCGQGLYAQIHMILWKDERIECWGSGCYKRELVHASGGRQQPLYPRVTGRKLTDQERELLRNNREQLIADFKFQQESLLTAKQSEEQANRNAIEDSARASQTGDGRATYVSSNWRFQKPLELPPRTEPTQKTKQQLLEQARETIKARWYRQGSDPTGLSRLFEVEVNWEYERLLARN